MLKRAAVAVVCLAGPRGLQGRRRHHGHAEATDGTGTIDTFITLDARSGGAGGGVGPHARHRVPARRPAAPRAGTISPLDRAAPTARRRCGCSTTTRARRSSTSGSPSWSGRRSCSRAPKLTARAGLLRSHDELVARPPTCAPSTGDPAGSRADRGAPGRPVSTSPTLDQQLQAELREALSVSVTVKAPGDRGRDGAGAAGRARRRPTAARSRSTPAASPGSRSPGSSRSSGSALPRRRASAPAGNGPAASAPSASPWSAPR